MPRLNLAGRLNVPEVRQLPLDENKRERLRKMSPSHRCHRTDARARFVMGLNT